MFDIDHYALEHHGPTMNCYILKSSNIQNIDYALTCPYQFLATSIFSHSKDQLFDEEGSNLVYEDFGK
jgi:hypothetical protein